MVKKLEVQNFEGFKTGSWEFGKVNYVSGWNGSGKSSIGRAIAWCLTGRNTSGSQSTDHYSSLGATEPTFVRMTLPDGSTIERRQAFGAKSLKVNGVDTTQTDLDKGMPISWETFFSVFLVGYFHTEHMNDKDRRALIMKLTPDIDKQALFEEQLEARLKDKVKEKPAWLLPKVEIDWNVSMTKIHEFWNNRKKALIAQINQLIGASEQIIKVLEAVVVPEESSTNIDLAKSYIKEWEAVYSQLTKKKKDHDGWLRLKEAADNQAKVMVQIKEHNKRYSLLENEILNLTANIDDLSTIRLSAITKLQEVPKDLQLGECSNCGSKITATLIKRRQALIDEANQTRQKVQNEISSLDEQILDLRERRNEKIQERLKMGGLKSEAGVDVCAEPEFVSEEQLADVRNQLEQAKKQFYEDQNKDVLRKQTLDTKLRYEKELQIAGTKLEQHKKDLIILDEIVEILHPVRGIDAEVIKRKVEAIKPPQGMEFILRDVHKNGEPYECFKILVNGIPFDNLSDGQKIVASLKVSMMLDALSGNKVGMYYIQRLDLADGQVSFDFADNTQVFLERVSPNPLTVAIAG